MAGDDVGRQRKALTVNRITKIASQDITQIYNADKKLIAEVQEYAVGGKYEVQYFRFCEGRGWAATDKRLFNSLTGAFKNAHEYCDAEGWGR